MITPLASASPGTVKVRLSPLPPVLPMLAPQPAKTQPSSGTAVTVEQVPPLATIWLVEPLRLPPSLHTNSTGTLVLVWPFSPRTAMGSLVIRFGVTPCTSGTLFRGLGRVSSVM